MRAERSLADVPGYEGVKSAGGMGRLAVKTTRMAVRLPLVWWRDCVLELSTAIRRATLPLVLSTAFFSLGLVTVYFAGLVQRLGTIERTGAAVMAGFTREVAVWITMMIVAGTAGAAITADLGARKIRDELDALAVLGLDTTRTLVVPRVLAVTLATPILGMFGLLTACLTCYFAMTTLYADSVTGAALAESAWAFAYWQDFVNYALKFIVCGVFIGIVACYKGLTSGGGTEGVGRAVNQSVLITFFGVWFIHTMINIAFFALFPELLVLRG